MGTMLLKRPSEELSVCAECIGNDTFAEWIISHGKVGECDFDPSHVGHEVVPIGLFAESVDTYFRERYQWTEDPSYVDPEASTYNPPGEPFREILEIELECDAAVVTALAECLPDESDRDISQGAEAFYDDFRNYELTSIADRRAQERYEEHLAEDEYWFRTQFSIQWEEFCETVKYERRFFEIKEPLDSLFGSPVEYDKGIIKPVYTLPAGQKLFRARLLDDNFTEKVLRDSPAQELGCPPKRLARAGRMNVEFIPAFYAAFSEDVAIAELRPGIGESLAVGVFVLEKSLKVFDFTVFSSHLPEDRNISAHSRYEFIRQLEGEISKPVPSYGKQLEYIPTQIAAEYLKEYFACDAVIYKSSMVSGGSNEVRNIVVFDKGGPFVALPRGMFRLEAFAVKDIRNVQYTYVDAHAF